MWKGKKRFGGGGEPAAKRQATGEDGPSESEGDGIVVAEISKNKRVSVRNWKGKVFVDMREFYVKDGKTLPTRKGLVEGRNGGSVTEINRRCDEWIEWPANFFSHADSISLQLDQWKILRDNIKAIDEAIKENV